MTITPLYGIFYFVRDTFLRKKTAKQLGLQEPDFPLDIMEQLKSPFISNEK